MPFEKDPNDIGALWERTGAKGPYLSGKINGVDVICFRNKSDNPKAPQWKVLKSQPRSSAPAHEPHNANVREPGDDDIPF